MTVKPNPKEYYVFPEGNTIPYGQDFAFPRGIPAGVIFEKEDFTNDRCRLIAPGYGKKDNYGNGAIYVNIKELKPEYEFTPKESGAGVEEKMQLRRKIVEIAQSILRIPDPNNLEEANAADYAFIAKIDALENLVSQAVATEVENTKERLHTYLKQLVWTDEDIAALDRRVFSLSAPTTVQDTREEK